MTKQLPLTPVSPTHRTLDLRGDAKGFTFGPKDDRDPMKRAHIVIGKYVGRYGRQPGFLTCSPAEAAAIGSEVLGVPVFEISTGPGVYRLGPPQEA